SPGNGATTKPPFWGRWGSRDNDSEGGSASAVRSWARLDRFVASNKISVCAAPFTSLHVHPTSLQRSSSLDWTNGIAGRARAEHSVRRSGGQSLWRFGGSQVDFAFTMLHLTDDLRIERIRPLISPAILMEELPISERASTIVAESRNAISRCLRDEDDRLVVV